MKSSGKFGLFSSSSTTTVIFNFHNDHTTLHQTTEIPISSPSPPPPTSPQTSAPAPVTDAHLPQSEAAARIQAAYRAHLVRGLYKKISAVNQEADKLQRLIQLQETVDSIRSDDREKLRMNEALMALLLRLDSVPGIDPSVREARRKVSRRVVALQEILDSISEAKGYCYDSHGADYLGDLCGWCANELYMRKYWEEVAEEDLCRQMGGDYVENFCAQHLGFRCLQRFLRE